MTGVRRSIPIAYVSGILTLVALAIGFAVTLAFGRNQIRAQEA